MSEKVELLIHNCSQAILCGPESQAEGADSIESAAMAIADGKIIAVGSSSEICSEYQAHEKIDAGGKLLTPAFVDSHTHAVFGGDRSAEYAMRCQGATYEEISKAGGGIRSTVRATRQCSEEELYINAKARIDRMLAAGSATIEVKSGYGLDWETEHRLLKVVARLQKDSPARIVPTFMGAHEIPDEFRSDRTAFIDSVCEQMIPAVAEQKLAEYCDVFCEEGVFTAEESIKILECGKAAGLKPKIHADELAASGGSRVAAKVGAVSADHLMKTDVEGAQGMRDAGVVATILPGTTFYLRKPGYADARMFLNEGLNVAIATDRNPGSCTIESMQFILGLSCLNLQMTPLEAFRAATEQGARALDRFPSRGRLAAGFDADFIIWDCQTPEQVTYEFMNEIGRKVFVAGKLSAGIG